MPRVHSNWPIAAGTPGSFPASKLGAVLSSSVQQTGPRCQLPTALHLVPHQRRAVIPSKVCGVRTNVHTVLGSSLTTLVSSPYAVLVKGFDMPAPVRNRQSCDRCHTQKLKCPKQAGSPICTRCMKAGAVCAFSPPGGGSSSRKASEPIFPPDHGGMSSSAGVEGGDLPAYFDWSFLQPNFAPSEAASAFQNLGGPFGHGGQGYAGVAVPGQDSSGQPGAEAKASEPDQPPPNPKSQCIHHLTSILVDLDAVWVSMPPKTSLHFPLDENIDKFTAAFAEKYSQHKSVERLFGAAQRLVDLYPTVIPLSLALNSADQPRCEPDTCVHSIEPPANLRAVESSAVLRDSPSTIDHPLANLLIACHLRLIDVLDHLLLLVLSCFKLHAASPTRMEPNFGVPELRVGSFTPTRASAAFMQAFLMKHLIGILSDRVDEFSRAVESKLQGNPDKECRVLAMQCEILKERQADKVAQIGELSEALVTAGMLK